MGCTSSRIISSIYKPSKSSFSSSAAAEVEAGSKKKAEAKGYVHRVASTGIPEINKGDELNADIRKVLEQLVKDCKTPVPNKERLFADYVESESEFAFAFDIDQDYWKSLFKIISEEKNA